MLLSFQTGFNLLNAAVVYAILESIPGLGPSSDTTEPRHLKLVTVSSLCPFTLISLFMPLVLSLTWSSRLRSPCNKLWRLFRDAQLASSSSSPAEPSMSSAKRGLVTVLPPMLTVPSRFSKESVMTLSRNMLKRVGESSHPCRTPTVVRNQSLMLLLKRTALVAWS